MVARAESEGDRAGWKWCVDCGDWHDLTADFLPGGPHSRNIADYETRCRPCHGRRHAERAAGGAL